MNEIIKDITYHILHEKDNTLVKDKTYIATCDDVIYMKDDHSRKFQYSSTVNKVIIVMTDITFTKNKKRKTMSDFEITNRTHDKNLIGSSGSYHEYNWKLHNLILTPVHTGLRSWVSASTLRNYMLEDTLVDWLRLHESIQDSQLPKLTSEENLVEERFDISHKDYIMGLGVNYETKIFNELKLKYKIEQIEKGFEGTSIRDISKHAKIERKTLCCR